MDSGLQHPWSIRFHQILNSGKTYSCQRCGLNLDADLDAATNI